MFFCDLNEFEDEYRFIMMCLQYCDIRIRYIKKYYYTRTRPSMLKLVHLFQNGNLTHVKMSLDMLLKHLRNSLVNKNKYMKCEILFVLI